MLKSGRVVYAFLAEGMTASTRHVMFSVSKSVAGLVFGMLVDRRLIEPQRPVEHYLPAMSGSAYADASVQQVLDMSVGVDFRENYALRGDDVDRYRRATGWDVAESGDGGETTRQVIRALPRAEFAHGDRFNYVSPNTDLLGWLAEAVTGTPYPALLTEWLWQPLGAEYDADFPVDRRGVARAAGGLCATLADIGRVGLLMTQTPPVEGILPAAFVHDTLTRGDAAAWDKGTAAAYMPGGSYRNQWYVPNGKDEVCIAIGIHGQWLYVDRRRDVVIVKQSSQPEAVQMATDFMMLRMFEAVARALA